MPGIENHLVESAVGDVARLEWSVEAGRNVAAGQEIGFIEGSKATSDLYAPLAGRVGEINHEAEAHPTTINSDLYDSAWLLALRADADPLLTPEEYLAHLEVSWPLAQRLLKGQAGGAGLTRTRRNR